MVTSFLQRCFGYGTTNNDGRIINKHSDESLEIHYGLPSRRAQDEEVLSFLREPLLFLEGSWFNRMRRVLDVLQDCVGLRAMLIGVARNDSQPNPACYVLLQSSNARTDDAIDHGKSFPCLDREAAVIILQACASKMAVGATATRFAACVPLMHGGVAVGALWLTLVNPQDREGVAPASMSAAAATASATGTRASALGSGAPLSAWASYSGPAASAAAASALLFNGASLNTLAFTISMAAQGSDPDQLPWLTAAVHRLCTAATLHALAAELCELLAAHVLRRFMLETAVRAVLVPGDSGVSCGGASDNTAGSGGSGGGGGGVGYLLGASAGLGTTTGSPPPHSTTSSRGSVPAKCRTWYGNACSLNGASPLELQPGGARMSGGTVGEAATGLQSATVLAAEGQWQRQALGQNRPGSLCAPGTIKALRLGTRPEPKPRRFSLLMARSQSGATSRDVVKEPATAPTSQATQQTQQTQQQPLRASPSLQYLVFQQQKQTLGLGAAQCRLPGSLLTRRTHSVKSMATADLLPAFATGVGVGGTAALAMDLIISRRTLSGTTTTRPLVVALPLGPDAAVTTAGSATSLPALRAALDTRASKSANAANTCTNINNFLVGFSCNPASAVMSSWQGGIPPPAATVTAHTFSLQHTLLQACFSNAATAPAGVVSGNGSAGSGRGIIRHPGVVEDCCTLLQDVNRPCRDVCLLMGVLNQRQELQKLQQMPHAISPIPAPALTPLQQACSQLQENLHTNAMAATTTPWRAMSPGGRFPGLRLGPNGFPQPAAPGGGGASATPALTGVNGGGLRGGGGFPGVGLRSLAVVLVPSHGLTVAAQSAPGEGGGGASGKGAPGSPSYLGMYLCFSTRLPRPLLEAVRASCQELVDEALGHVVTSRIYGDLAPELDVYKSAAPGSYAVLRGMELNDDALSVNMGPTQSVPAAAAAAAAAASTAADGGSSVNVSGRTAASRRRGLSGTHSGVGAHVMSLLSRSSSQQPHLVSNNLLQGGVPGGGSALFTQPPGQGPYQASRNSVRQLRGIISGMLMNTEDLVERRRALEVNSTGLAVAAAAAAAMGPGHGPPPLPLPPLTPCGCNLIPPPLLRGFLSMRGIVDDDGGGRAGDITGSSNSGSCRRPKSLTLDRPLRSFTGEPRTQAAPCVPVVSVSVSARGGQPMPPAVMEAAAVAAASVAAADRDDAGGEAHGTTAITGGVGIGVGVGCSCPPDQLLSTATTNVEDLLISLMDSMGATVQNNSLNNTINNASGTDRLVDSGAGARGAVRSDTGGGGGLLWQCDSILHVTAEDDRDLARQQMDMLVNSITATAADCTAAARAPFLGDLAYLQLQEVLGRGGGGVVLRGKSGTTDVAVKLMEMPVTPDVQPSAQQQQEQQPLHGKGRGANEHRNERDRLLLRNRRAMLRQAMELWCGTMLSHPNIVQVYTTFNSVVLKLRKCADGGREFYLQAMPETGCTHQHHQLQGTAATVVPDGHPAGRNSAAGAARQADDEGYGSKEKDKDKENELVEPSESICTALMVEWCDKGSLAAALYNKTFPRVVPRHYDDIFRVIPYDMKEVYSTLLDVALALRHLHALHLVHRDIKSANLLLKSNPSDPRGFTVKLADFGFVLQLSEVDADGHRYVLVDQPAGTVTHMPPEALSREPRLDASADVYGFGIVMWELLAGGLRPYSQVPLDRILRLVVKGGRPNFPESVPLSYRRLAAACWSSQPSKRPWAAELVDILTAELATLQ